MPGIRREGGAHARLALHRDEAAGVLHHFLHHVKAHARAPDVGVVALQQPKQRPLGRETQAQAIALHGQHPVV